jgi:endonuclease/exonuclease/phosphatase family metal-dependent hydrolase
MLPVGRRIRATVVALLVLAVVVAGAAQPAAARPGRQLSVATYNLYLGADLTPLFGATSQQELAQRAAEVYAHVVKTDFPSRAEAIAALLARRPPDLVGLQEVALWETGPIGGALTPSYDFLRLLLDALAARGLAYRPAVANVNFGGALPVGATTMVRFTDRDVILVRAGGRLRLSQPQSHTFLAKLVIPTAIPGLAFTVPRGWSAVDVTVGGRTVRFADTHLEAFSADVRAQQAAELLGALLGSRRPVVLVGDLNSTPDDAAGAYGTLTRGGFADAWVVVHGPEGGFTSGQSADLDNVPSLLDHRIDDVLYQPVGVRATAAEVIGEELGDRTPAGLWPSDHAGVVARLRLTFG